MVLLDVNVLIALAWSNHQFHGLAVKRMNRAGEHWATCAITQLGFIRISSMQAMSDPPYSATEAAELLALMVADKRHVFLPSLGPASGLEFWPKVVGHRQVTDAYLIHVAHSAKAKLLTFDTRLRYLEIIPV